jgi:hypothetical protein
MKPVYTLLELADPMSPISSTASISVSVRGEQANSFSLPPFLYYANKAKVLARLGIADEREAKDGGYLDVRDTIVNEMREVARSVHRDIQYSETDMSGYVSAAIQSRLLFKILGESEVGLRAIDNSPAEPINASKSKKNVTIPAYLYARVIELLGSERQARQEIHSRVFDIKQALNKAGGLNEKGGLVGDPSNSSWSRKLHNSLFLSLLKMSNIPELHTSPSILDVKMLRDPKIETRIRNGTLKLPE